MEYGVPIALISLILFGGFFAWIISSIVSLIKKHQKIKHYKILLETIGLKLNKINLNEFISRLAKIQNFYLESEKIIKNAKIYCVESIDKISNKEKLLHRIFNEVNIEYVHRRAKKTFR